MIEYPSNQYRPLFLFRNLFLLALVFLWRFHIQHIIFFFFANAETVTQVDAETAGIAFAEATCIYSTLLQYKMIVVGIKQVVHT